MGAEWTYLLTTRVVAGNSNPFTYVRLKYGNNATDTVTGMVIYPDDFSFADAGVGAMTFGAAVPAVIEIDAWRALETAGCVFLPASSRLEVEGSGLRIPEDVLGLQSYYWNSTASTSANADAMCYNVSALFTRGARADARKTGYCVRLAQDYR